MASCFLWPSYGQLLSVALLWPVAFCGPLMASCFLIGCFLIYNYPLTIRKLFCPFCVSAQFNNKLYQSFSLRLGDRSLFDSLLISISFQIPNLNHDKVDHNGGQNVTSLLAVYSFVVNRQHVSAYSEAIIRFTNVSYRRVITLCGCVVGC
jgi:hypothetical protein